VQKELIVCSPEYSAYGTPTKILVDNKGNPFNNIVAISAGRSQRDISRDGESEREREDR